MRLAYGVRQPCCNDLKKAILQSRFARATRRVCDGSGVLIKSYAVVKRNASDFIKMERA